MAVDFDAPSTTFVLLTLFVLVSHVAVYPTTPSADTGVHESCTDIVWGQPSVEAVTVTLVGAGGKAGWAGFSSVTAASIVAIVFFDMPSAKLFNVDWVGVFS